MTAYVFVGPTLKPQEVAAILPDAICLPPVAQGDVYRAARTHPRAIGIIDGFFSGAPSVWHKEILWALAEGVPVFGSASMGALRAAELHAFGMRGVGRIFQAYVDGDLEDDDEVAVVHGPPETGYVAASEPMVNIRATLERARADGVISETLGAELEAAAKAMYFPRRTWPALMKVVAGQSGVEAELGRLKAWLPGGAVDQKREDALEMLAAMRDAPERAASTATAFRFEQTRFWEDLVRREDQRPVSPGLDADQAGVLEELRLLGPSVFHSVARNALLRALADSPSRGSAPLPTESISAASVRLRETLGLFTREQLQTWMLENDLDQPSFDRLVESDARLAILTESLAQTSSSYLLDEIRISGRYKSLVWRAQDKAEKLAGPTGGASSSEPMPNGAQLRLWYFEQRLEQSVPDDIAAFTRALGWGGVAEFDRALGREWMYSRLTGRSPEQRAEDADREPTA